MPARHRGPSRAGARSGCTLLATLWLAGCGVLPRPASPPAGLEHSARRALAFAAEQYRRAATTLDPAAGYPRSTRPDDTWRTVRIDDWTSGFFPGTLWLLADYTGDTVLRAEAERWTWPLAAITAGNYDHDLGFQYLSSFGNAYRVTGDERFREPLLDAAAHLARRFSPAVGAIRSWSWGEWQYPVIIDNLMNLELLLRAARLGGDTAWVRMARSHADRTLENHLRSDGGSFHVVDYSPENGTVLARMTRQGLADSTTWARGQAWGIYGYTMLHRYTGDVRYLIAARQLADYVLPRLPADHIPCWDYQAPGCPATAPRDASAAAIMAAALPELAARTGGEDAVRYQAAAERMLEALTSPAYLALGTSTPSILRHAVGDLPRGTEVGAGIVYADYYFVEALLRYLGRR
jgi:uncharacterized protein YyaL (SSP411 family)